MSLCTCLSRTVAQSSLRGSVVASGSTSRSVTGIRYMHASAVASALQRVPEKRERISTPTEFLTKIGRSMAEHDGKLGSTWEELWSRYATSEDLEKAGVSAPKERKYILRQMNNYKNGQEIKAIRAKPKKKFRGRGARVQKGVRVR